jgi:hypothetical protein
VLETVTDFVAEGRLHFHPKNFSQSYYDQIEEVFLHHVYFDSDSLGEAIYCSFR